MTYILIAEDGHEYGPYTISQLGTLADESRLHARSRLRDEHGMAVIAQELLDLWPETSRTFEKVPDARSSNGNSRKYELEKLHVSESDLRALILCRQLLILTIGTWMCAWMLILFAVVNRDVRFPNQYSELEWIGRSFHLISALIFEACLRKLPYGDRIKGVGKQPNKSLGILYCMVGPASPILIYDLYKRLNCFLKVLDFPDITSSKVVEHIKNRINLHE